MRYRFTKPLLIICFLLSLSGKVFAVDYNWFTYGGFISQGFVSSGGNNFLGNSKQGSFDLFQAGINAHATLNDRFALAGQLLSRDYGVADYNESILELDYLFLSSMIFANDSLEISGQIGQYKTTGALHGRTRDYPQTYSTVILPMVIYNEYGRNIAVRSQGISLDILHQAEWGSLDIALSYGSMVSDDEDTKREVAYLYGGMKPDDLLSFSASDEPRFMFRVAYHSPDLKWTLGFSQVTYNIKTSQEFDGVGPVGYYRLILDVDRNSSYPVIFARYQGDRFGVSAEFLKPDYEIQLDYQYVVPAATIPPINFKVDNGYHYYVELSYLFRDDLTGFVRKEYAVRDKDDLDGTNAGYSIQPNDNYRDAWVMGVDWEIINRLNLKAEIQYLEGAYFSHQSDNDMSSLEKYWHIFMMQVSYSF